MMNHRVLTVSFSGVYKAQGFAPQGAQNLCLEALSGTSCYCDDAAREEIIRRLPGDLPRLRWIDSGDYHYMSCLLAMLETEPFHLVLLDHHPDNQEPAFGGVLSCGSWVKELQERQSALKSVLTIGPEGCPQDIPESWMEERRGERLYISLDKDIMAPAYARTDWSQGEHSLQQVKEILRKLLGGGMEVVAIDICGEHTESKGASPEDLRINKETNIELQEFITTYLK